VLTTPLFRGVSCSLNNYLLVCVALILNDLIINGQDPDPSVLVNERRAIKYKHVYNSYP